MRLRGTTDAPAERLAAFRIALGVFIIGYVAIRVGVFVELGSRERSRFEPVGVFRFIDQPMGEVVNGAVLVATFVLGVAFVVGWRFRLVGPLFALGLLALTSHRSSWGQLLHFENLMVLHAVVVGLSPAADAWSWDARRAARRSANRAGVARAGALARAGGDRYGFPLLVASVIVVVTYVIAGVAKLRYGGVDWMAGDTLRNHIAYSATRLELLGGWASPAARVAVDAAWILPPIAALSVLVELAAPMALLGGRWRNIWVVTAWLMHAGIYVLMLVGFPSPLFLIAFAPFFPLERIVDYRATLARRGLATQA